MKVQLPSAENQEIDKFAIMLKSPPGKREGEGDKMIGIVGTNRWSEQGMETGYCINIEEWGKGYASEAFKAFLEWFWGLPGMHFLSTIFPSHLGIVEVGISTKEKLNRAQKHKQTSSKSQPRESS
jgi:hypothetical protein